MSIHVVDVMRTTNDLITWVLQPCASRVYRNLCDRSGLINASFLFVSFRLASYKNFNKSHLIVNVVWLVLQ